MRPEDTASCIYGHVKVEKWKDIFKLIRTVLSDNSIIKTIKTAVIVHPKKNILLTFAMFPRDLELHTTYIYIYIYVSYVGTHYTSDSSCRSCVSCGTWRPVYIKKNNLEATFSSLQLKKQKNRSCFGK